MSIVEQLRARLTTLPDHPDFVGAPLNLDGVNPVQLGYIWTDFRKAQRLDSFDDPRRKFAAWLHVQLVERDLDPLLDDTTGLAVFRDIRIGDWSSALGELPHLARKPTAEIQLELVRIMGKRPEHFPGGGIYEAYVMGHFAGGHGLAELREEVFERFRESPCRLREFDVLPELGPVALFALVRSHGGYFISGKKYDFASADTAVFLAEDLAYLEFAHETLTYASERIADIQSGKIPYKSDAAFSTDDAQVVSRAVRIASYRDEPWLRPIIGPLLVGACVAPTSAKTAPSQSLAIALGHSIEEIPTPESVLALRAALAAVRHAGVEKKLSRNVKPAERALGERPGVALRMTHDVKPDKKQQAMLATCMEAGLAQGMLLTSAEWRQRLVDAPAGLPFASKVVWLEKRADGTTQSFIVEAAASGIRMHKADGSPCTVDVGSSISLWHPLLADEEERHAWQQFVLANKIRQPIRQVFREYYVPGAEELEKNISPMFDGHVLSVRSLIGLARREGWSVGKYDGLTRQFGDIRVTFVVHADIYPGADGEATTGELYFVRRKGARWLPVSIAQLGPILFSEIARAADLLVSVAGFGLTDERSAMPMSQAAARWRQLGELAMLPLGVMAHNRKNTLAMLFARQIEQGAMSVDARHLRIGDYAVHLATARVTKAGEPCEIDTVPRVAMLKSTPWLPYDEVLLQRIVDAAVSILGGDQPAAIRK